MPAVETERVTGQQPAHDNGVRMTAGSRKQMKVVVDLRPCTAERSIVRYDE